jgi:hypothetical protein
MTPQQVRPLRRALTAIALGAAGWAALVTVTGGVVLEALSITSRNPRNPLLIAAVAALTAWALPMPNRLEVVAEAWRAARRLAVWPRPASSRWRWLEPAVLVALGFAAFDVFLWAGGRPLWLDEEMLALNLRDRNVTELGGALWLGQSAPFGWLVLGRGLLALFGTDERVLRLLPMLFGCGLLATALWAGRHLLSPWGAALFVLLCAVGRWVAHYRFELKHYSADAFWGLLLPVLAIWILKQESHVERTRGIARWWLAAILGLWIANGALLATPACALILLWAEWRRAGWPAAWRAARPGLVWAASAGLHYFVSLRHAVTDQTLREYWVVGFAPEPASLAGLVTWMALRLEPLAFSPGGTGAWAAFWLSAVAGFLLAGRQVGAVLAAMPLSAFAWAGVGLVPVHDRLALWTAPALYLGIVCFVERAVRRTRATERRFLRGAMAAAAIVAVTPLVTDIFDRGWVEYRDGRWPTGNHGLHDRTAVRWLLGQRRAGDVIVTTRMGAPAVWWYGVVAIGNPSAGRTLSDGTSILLAAIDRAGTCTRDPLLDLLSGHRRVLMYVGFPDEPPGFIDLLLARLSQVGTIVTERRFDLVGRTAIVELGGPTPRTDVPAAPAAGPTSALRGCIEGRPAERW